jgi:hypothetical protein
MLSTVAIKRPLGGAQAEHQPTACDSPNHPLAIQLPEKSFMFRGLAKTSEKNALFLRFQVIRLSFEFPALVSGR